ncbi:MAG: hypothetical protein QG673_1746 [Pseudomonadota bacterium]|nr:hypothetical protein [Pseudomonadota bacterium]
MKSKLFKLGKSLLAVIIVTLSLVGCGASNNVTFSTTNGECATGQSGAPYCMSVKIQNNNGGQNWITSTNFPISDIAMTISGVGNLQSPATNQSAMDPNNCTGSTIDPGGSCTFYLQLTGENFSVESQENIDINVTYTINDTLFGSSSNTSSSSFTVYELTNLYVMQNNSNLTIYNSSWNNYGRAESSNPSANSLAIDTNSFGLAYFSNNLGIYNYGISDNLTSSSISAGNIIGANNLFTYSSNLYAANVTSNGSSNGVYSWSLSGESWNSSSSPVCLPINTTLVNNANAISPTPVTYLASSSKIYACTNSTGNPQNTQEGLTGLSGSINTLAFSTDVTSSSYSGLYAGTSQGLFVESGVTASQSATWSQVTSADGALGEITALTVASESDTEGIIFAGGADGQIWVVLPESPTVAQSLAAIPGSQTAISSMVMDSFGGILYVSAGNIVYGCSIGDCVSVLNPLAYTNSVIGMGIGSFLTDSLDNPYDNGDLGDDG